MMGVGKLIAYRDNVFMSKKENDPSFETVREFLETERT